MEARFKRLGDKVQSVVRHLETIEISIVMEFQDERHSDSEAKLLSLLQQKLLTENSILEIAYVLSRFTRSIA